MSSNKTNFLCATMTPGSGAATVINLAGNFYDFNYSQSPEEADWRALASDWAIVGEDLRLAIGDFWGSNKRQLELKLEY